MHSASRRRIVVSVFRDGREIAGIFYTVGIIYLFIFVIEWRNERNTREIYFGEKGIFLLHES